jgi:hypothetical protein
MGGFIIGISGCSVLRTKQSQNKEFINNKLTKMIDLHYLGLLLGILLFTMPLLFTLKN